MQKFIAVIGMVLLTGMAGCGSKGNRTGEAPASPSVYSDTPGSSTDIGRRIGMRIYPGQKEHPELPDLAMRPIVDSRDAREGYNPDPNAKVLVAGNTIMRDQAI